MDWCWTPLTSPGRGCLVAQEAGRRAQGAVLPEKARKRSAALLCVRRTALSGRSSETAALGLAGPTTSAPTKCCLTSARWARICQVGQPSVNTCRTAAECLAPSANPHSGSDGGHGYAPELVPGAGRIRSKCLSAGRAGQRSQRPAWMLRAAGPAPPVPVSSRQATVSEPGSRRLGSAVLAGQQEASAGTRNSCMSGMSQDHLWASVWCLPFAALRKYRTSCMT